MSDVSVFPFLTEPDPVTSGEGALDPLGLAAISERLAEHVLPGLRARMARPRFLTAIAVASAVCEGLEDQFSSDGRTPAYLVFEWLVVEGFVRAADAQDTRGTPGTLKARAAVHSRIPLSPQAYLRVPTVFGFHGVYKPLARNLSIVDEDLRLADNGYALVKTWQNERGLEGFLDSSVSQGPGSTLRAGLRAAVEEGLRAGHSTRSAVWSGWRSLGDNLVPARMGRGEARFLHQMLLEDSGGTRGEVFRLLEAHSTKYAGGDDAFESDVIKRVLLPRCSPELKQKLDAIVAFEAVATLLEDAFDWICYLSTVAGARPITAVDYAAHQDVRRIEAALAPALDDARDAIEPISRPLEERFAELAGRFYPVRTPSDLFEAILDHHHRVQQAKPPEGKREWFERDASGATIVRVPYRHHDAVQPRDWWERPYRINAARSFLSDLVGS